jgi:hypothetical protein
MRVDPDDPDRTYFDLSLEQLCAVQQAWPRRLTFEEHILLEKIANEWKEGNLTQMPPALLVKAFRKQALLQRQP